jgi:hypothetical protein
LVAECKLRLQWIKLAPKPAANRWLTPTATTERQRYSVMPPLLVSFVALLGLGCTCYGVPVTKLELPTIARQSVEMTARLEQAW